MTAASRRSKEQDHHDRRRPDTQWRPRRPQRALPHRHGRAALQRAITDHLRYSIGRPAAALQPEHYYRALALAVRDRMQDRRVASTQTSLDLGRKVTYYLSAEFLMGPQLGNNLLNLGL